MARRLSIAPVGWAGRQAAVCFLAGGRVGCDADQAQALAAFARQTGWRNVALWWARDGRTPVAAAMVVQRPGRTGMLFHSPAAAEGVDGEVLGKLVGEISQDALGRGMTIVQSLLDPRAGRDIEVLSAAGYRLLARLTYMRLDIARSADGGGSRQAFTWRNSLQFSAEQLERMVAGTYAGSLDCPALAGLREVPDVIAGHKSAAAFCPRAWLICYVEGSPAGCILVNDSRDGVSAEVAYMGVLPAYRGHGVATALVGRSAELARRRARSSLTLSVDADNRFAVRRYLAEGFRQEGSRLAYAACSRGPLAGPSSEPDGPAATGAEGLL